ncbi:hypothetical protein AB0D04_26765 [Streptomyces sp. NPDC048483]|uniref:hypothetical protein n=1 Tax=Streptomyces sp. NPDC048483 TaxID=3154927 RepID=UPI0034245CF6
MNSDVLRWLQAQLGPDLNSDDLAARYERLHSARAVALEVLHERVAALVALPLKVTVNGVATIDNSANVAALERRIAQLDSEATPDDTPAALHDLLTTVQLHARRRREDTSRRSRPADKPPIHGPTTSGPPGTSHA